MEKYLDLQPAAKGAPTMMNDKKLFQQEGLLWGCFDLKSMKPATAAAPAESQAPGPMGMPNPMETINKGGFNLNFVGPKKEDISFVGNLQCIDAKAAQQYSLLAQQASMMMTIAMQQDPQLAMEVVQAIKVNAEESDTHIRILLSKSLMDRLKAFSEKNQGGAEGGVEPAPAPAPAP
jgi:hypothetical protein